MAASARRVLAVIIMALSLVFALHVTPVFAAFTDTNGHWATNAIESLAANDIIGGYPDNTFKPEQPITRAEFAKLVAAAFDIQPAQGAAFIDTAGHWANSDIAALSQAGYVTGYPDNTFKPDRPITRAESTLLMGRVLEVSDLAWFADTSEASFLDVDQDHWAFPSVEAMDQLGVLPAFMQDAFDPDAQLTRAEAAWMLYQGMRLSREVGTVTFADAPTSRVTIETQNGRIRDFRTDTDTMIVREDALESLDGLTAGDSVFVVADRFGTPRLIAAGEGAAPEDLTQQIAAAVLDVFTVEELQTMLAGDWSVAADGIGREVEERLLEAGISEAEAQALLTQDWSSLQSSVTARLQNEIKERLSISDELANALINRDWTTAREQAQLDVAEHLLNRLLSTMDAPA